MEEKIKEINLERLKQAIYPLSVTQEDGRIYVSPAVKSDFIVKTTVDKVAGAVALFGFGGYMIKIENDGLKFWIY